MRYRLNGHLFPMQEKETLSTGDVLVEVLTREAYLQTKMEQIHRHVLDRSLEHLEYCKVDLLPGCAVGTFSMPQKEDLLGTPLEFGFYMDRKSLLLVDDSGRVAQMLQHLTEIQVLEKTQSAHFLFELMEYLIRDDVLFLQRYEQKLEELEERLATEQSKNFSRHLMTRRKELLNLLTYYRQLGDMSRMLEENENGMLSKEDCRLFGFYSDRVSRLEGHVQQLRESAVQIRELQQTQMDVRQNQIMQLLTVVTTIFMPLTLVTGWYGMNFVHMPELQQPYAYGIVIVVSLVIVLLEILYFKKKNWFK